MTLGTDVDSHLFNGRRGLKYMTTTAMHLSVYLLWMNSRFHGSSGLRLTLGVLLALSRFASVNLLAFDFSRISRKESGLAQWQSVLFRNAK
jgi:hypothetical protein